VERQRHWNFTLVLVFALIFFASAATVQAHEKSVVEEILDILLANHQITQQQYRYLLNKAKAEQRARSEQGSQKISSYDHPRKETEEVFPGNTKVDTYWEDGLKFETENKEIKVGLGGKIHYDFGDVNRDHDVSRALGKNSESGSKTRRTRLRVEGDVYKDFDFKAEYDFSSGDVEPKDVYLGVKKIPYVGSLQIGHTKEPFSLEELTSGSDVTFMERALPNAFAPKRNIGLFVHNSSFGEKLAWGLGISSETNDNGNGFGEDNRYNLTGHLLAFPWYKNDGASFLLLGTSFTHKFMDNGTKIRFKARPETHLTSSPLVDTRYIPSDGIDLVGTEAALVLDSFSLQSEYIHAFVNPQTGDKIDFDGCYIYGSYFITGEHRPYCDSKQAFGHVQPRRNFRLSGIGWGALEAAFRYSYLDLDDKQVHGGTLNDYTLGLNWYLNPKARVMFNYVHSHLNKVGDTDIIQSRLQLDF